MQSKILFSVIARNVNIEAEGIWNIHAKNESQGIMQALKQQLRFQFF